MFKNWKRRWFVLHTHFLYYFKSPDALHAIDRLDVRHPIVADSQDYAKSHLFTLTSLTWGRVYYFSVDARVEKESWMKQLSL